MSNQFEIKDINIEPKQNYQNTFIELSHNKDLINEENKEIYNENKKNEQLFS